MELLLAYIDVMKKLGAGLATMGLAGAGVGVGIVILVVSKKPRNWLLYVIAFLIGFILGFLYAFYVFFSNLPC
jgi:hypothetical protein